MNGHGGGAREDGCKAGSRVGWLFLLCWLVVSCLMVGCRTVRHDEVFQNSTIDALLAGVFDGDLTCGELLQHGDFGIGTFDALDGEMILVDGRLRQVKADGRVYAPSHKVKTPFATVCHFRPDATFDMSGPMDFGAVGKAVDRVVPNLNVFCAIRIEGRFRMMRTRSVPRQQKPYPALPEVARVQPEFPMENVEGTIVGFRCPSFVKGVNVPGYHLHFLSADESRGGHILALELEAGRCSVDRLDRFCLRLPGTVTDFATTDLAKDRVKELESVER